MKPSHLLLLLCFCLRSMGQANWNTHSQVWLNNRISGVVDARFTHQDGAGLEGSAYIAELVLIQNGSAIPITPTTTFRTGRAAGYVVPVDLLIPVPQGELGIFVLRAFEASAGSYDNAKNMNATHAEANPIILTMGSRFLPPVLLHGLGAAPAGSEPVNWTFAENRPPAGTVSAIRVVPEPSLYALALIGMVSLVGTRARRAKSHQPQGPGRN